MEVAVKVGLTDQDHEEQGLEKMGWDGSEMVAPVERTDDCND